MNIFKAYDIRGVYGRDITERTALNIGKALGTFLKGKVDVCVGYDTRKSSVSLFKNFVSGLTSTGCNVISLGMVPNPVAYFYAWKNKIYGCHITASHNPVSWNGFKLIKPDGTSFIEENKRIEDIFFSEKFLSKKSGRITKKNGLTSYARFLRGRVGKLKGKIVADFLGGAGFKSGYILKSCGLNVVELHSKPDASLYGFHMLEPWGNILDGARKAVKKEKADFGVAYDCDTDRSIFINPEGKYIDPSVIGGIFIKNIIRGGVVVTYDCASELERLVKKRDSKFYWSRIGHSFLEKKITEKKAAFAVEESSHYFFNDVYPFSDGILSTLMMCKVLSKTKKSFDELVGEMIFNPVEKIYIDAKTDQRKIAVIEKLRKRYPDSIDTSDGFKVRLNEVEWFIIRGSQTLPEINLCIEAKSEKRMKDLTKRFVKEIKKEL